MAEASSWVPAHAALTAAVYLAHFFINGATLFSTTGNVFTVIGNVLSFIFLDIAGIPDWFSLVLFMVVALPWLILIASILFSTTVGTIGTILGGIVAAVSGFFAGLF